MASKICSLSANSVVTSGEAQAMRRCVASICSPLADSGVMSGEAQAMRCRVKMPQALALMILSCGLRLVIPPSSQAAVVPAESLSVNANSDSMSYGSLEVIVVSILVPAPVLQWHRGTSCRWHHVLNDTKNAPLQERGRLGRHVP